MIWRSESGLAESERGRVVLWSPALARVRADTRESDVRARYTLWAGLPAVPCLTLTAEHLRIVRSADSARVVIAHTMPARLIIGRCKPHASHSQYYRIFIM